MLSTWCQTACCPGVASGPIGAGSGVAPPTLTSTAGVAGRSAEASTTIIANRDADVEQQAHWEAPDSSPRARGMILSSTWRP